MTIDRVLTWDGCNNVRDLGGLTTSTGHKTRWGAVVRSDHPAKLTADGWSQLYEHGIRTIISLRTHGLVEADYLDTTPRLAGITSIEAAIEDFTDVEFIKQWVETDLWCTPLYFRDALQRWPERHVAVIRAIAQAQPGGVLFHCKRGHDRTGIISLLLLALAGASPDDIVTDYELSVDPEREEFLAREHTTTREVILSTLASLDIEKYLLAGGLSQTDLDSIRTKLIDSSGNGYSKNV
ncbi:MAG: tyrosine-protein phosphatase [Chloroflexi bacterium]|nr:tyrosine-protein phosphatase [Chloroflexota bacterium]